MSRTYSPNTVYRQVSKELLEEFLVGNGCLDAKGIVSTLKCRDISPIVQMIDALDKPCRDHIESQLQDVFHLSSENGMKNIIEAANLRRIERFPAILPDDMSTYGKAMWTLLNHPDVFSTAVRFRHFDDLAWWKKRCDLPKRKPDLNPSAIKQLEAIISEYLWKCQGRGQRVTVETWLREGVTYYLVHPDDYLQRLTKHNEQDELESASFRPTFQLVFAFHEDEGSLELFARRLSSKEKGELEQLFGRVILDIKLAAEPGRPVYRLDHLKYRGAIPPTEAADGVEIMIKTFRLQVNNCKRRITIEADLNISPNDIYDALDQYLNQQNIPLGMVHVTLVTFVFKFRETGKRKPPTLTFDIAHPDSCSLRNQKPEFVEIARKYLKLMEIESGAQQRDLEVSRL